MNLYKTPILVCLFSLAILFVSCQINNNKYLYSTFQFGNEEREYIYYAPSDLKPNSPLVVAVHGYTDDAYNFMNYTGMNRWADSLGFAVCYPRGSKDYKGNRYWYVGYFFHKNNDVKDDCGLIEALAVYLQKKYNLSPDRTYLTGMSNGGDLCIKVACQGTGVFKAYAPLVGCMMSCIYDSIHFSPVPMLFINGTADSTTYFEGDILNKQGWGAYWGTDSMIGYFSRQNGYTGIIADTLPNPDKVKKAFAIRYDYVNSQTPTIFYKIIGGGHDWTGSSGSKCIEASKEIAEFFMQLP